MIYAHLHFGVVCESHLQVEADEDWSPLKCEVKKRSQGGQVFDEGIKGWIKTDSIG